MPVANETNDGARGTGKPQALVIVDPRSHTPAGQALYSEIRTRLHAAGVSAKPLITAGRGQVAAYLAAEDPHRFEVVCLIGGDGLLHEAANAILVRPPADRVPLALFPGGASNAVLNTLGSADPSACLERLFNMSPRRIDVARVHYGTVTRYAVAQVLGGPAARSAWCVERLRRLGQARYGLAALAFVLGYWGRRMRLLAETASGADVTEDCVLFLGQLSRGPTMGRRGRLNLAPRINQEDGCLDLIFAPRLGFVDRVRVLVGMRDGSYARHPRLTYLKVRSLRLLGPRPLRLNIDGEPIATHTRHVTIEALPAALPVLSSLTR